MASSELRSDEGALIDESILLDYRPRAELLSRPQLVDLPVRPPAPTGVYLIVYTFCMAEHVPVREFRSRLSELLDAVADRREHILVTRNGKPAAALVPIDEYDALEESAEILSDADALGAIEQGLAELQRDEVVSLEDLRAELAGRRRPR